MFLGLHHVAIIGSDYARTRAFYVEILGLTIVRETYRAERQSHKLDLALPGGTQLEIFSFPSPPPRPSRPEACGLRHLALRVAVDPVLAGEKPAQFFQTDHGASSLANRPRARAPRLANAA